MTHPRADIWPPSTPDDMPLVDGPDGRKYTPDELDPNHPAYMGPFAPTPDDREWCIAHEGPVTTPTSIRTSEGGSIPDSTICATCFMALDAAEQVRILSIGLEGERGYEPTLDGPRTSDD